MRLCRMAVRAQASRIEDAPTDPAAQQGVARSLAGHPGQGQWEEGIHPDKQKTQVDAAMLRWQKQALAEVGSREVA